MKRESLQHQFVEFVPASPEEGVLYISLEYTTAVHLCCCGCGQRVVAPLSPTDWALIFEGEVVSLSPSIGNWSFPCQSHYWIKRNQVTWAPTMSKAQIEEGRRTDRLHTDRFYAERVDEPDDVQVHDQQTPWWKRLLHRIRSTFGRN